MEQRGLVNVSNRLAQHPAFWWSGAPTSYPFFKARMLKAYPQAHQHIDSLLPVGFASADSSLAGAISSLLSITASLAENSQYWARRARQWSLPVVTGPMHRTLYEAALREGAQLLFDAWQQSKAARGWMVVEIEPCELHSVASTLRRARQLASLMPNIMVSVPLSEAGCEVIENLVASGHSVNASLCFSVAQVQAALAAISRGRQRARSQGTGLQRTRHLISCLPAGVLQHPVFTAQMTGAGVELTCRDLRWAEIALCRALCTAMPDYHESTSLIVCGFGSFLQWAPPGRRPILHSAGEEQFEQLINHLCTPHLNMGEPATQVPAEVMSRLMKVQGFRQVCGLDPLPQGCFARHPLYLQGIGQSLRAYTRLLGFSRQLNPSLFDETIKA